MQLLFYTLFLVVNFVNYLLQMTYFAVEENLRSILHGIIVHADYSKVHDQKCQWKYVAGALKRKLFQEKLSLALNNK